MEQDIKNIRQTLGLLSSMVRGGEQHSLKSEDQLESAFISLTKIERELTINKVLKTDEK